MATYYSAQFGIILNSANQNLVNLKIKNEIFVKAKQEKKTEFENFSVQKNVKLDIHQVFE
jgi:hypothetical protein